MGTGHDKTRVARIFVVDDNPTMRHAIAFIIQEEHDLTVCGEAPNIADALQQCDTLQPDLALIDISLKGEDGLDLVKRLKACAPSVRTVVFSLHDEPFYVDKARAAGAQGYVIKSGAPQQILDCIRQVLGGQSRFVHPDQQ